VEGEGGILEVDETVEGEGGTVYLRLNRLWKEW
jgi:hypothetical protein